MQCVHYLYAPLECLKWIHVIHIIIKFVIIKLLQKEMHVATCSDMQVHMLGVFTR